MSYKKLKELDSAYNLLNLVDIVKGNQIITKKFIADLSNCLESDIKDEDLRRYQKMYDECNLRNGHKNEKIKPLDIVTLTTTEGEYYEFAVVSKVNYETGKFIVAGNGYFTFSFDNFKDPNLTSVCFGGSDFREYNMSDFICDGITHNAFRNKDLSSCLYLENKSDIYVPIRVNHFSLKKNVIFNKYHPYSTKDYRMYHFNLTKEKKSEYWIEDWMNSLYFKSENEFNNWVKDNHGKVMYGNNGNDNSLVVFTFKEYNIRLDESDFDKLTYENWLEYLYLIDDKYKYENLKNDIIFHYLLSESDNENIFDNKIEEIIKNRFKFEISFKIVNGPSPYKVKKIVDTKEKCIYTFFHLANKNRICDILKKNQNMYKEKHRE